MRLIMPHILHDTYKTDHDQIHSNKVLRGIIRRGHLNRVSGLGYSTGMAVKIEERVEAKTVIRG